MINNDKIINNNYFVIDDTIKLQKLKNFKNIITDDCIYVDICDLDEFLYRMI